MWTFIDDYVLRRFVFSAGCLNTSACFLPHSDHLITSILSATPVKQSIWHFYSMCWYWWCYMAGVHMRLCLCYSNTSLSASVCYCVFVSCWVRPCPVLLSDWRAAEPLSVPVSNAGPLIQGVSTRSCPCSLLTDKPTPALSPLLTKLFSFTQAHGYSCSLQFRPFQIAKTWILQT